MRPLIRRVPLRRGAHPSRDDGMCAMEMVAWLAGEEHSDEPACACPVLGALVRASNDAMTDRQRDRHLRPLVPQLVNSRGSALLERGRGLLAIDCLVRTLLPRWLERHRRRDEAALLRGQAPIERLEHVAAARRLFATFVRGSRAARWVLDRALEGMPAHRYVTGVVQFARTLDDDASWAAVARLCERMLAADVRGEPTPAGE